MTAIAHHIDCRGGHIRKHRTMQGDTRLICTGCRQFTFVPDPPVIATPSTGRYQLTCIDCGDDFHVPSARPRIPRCNDCRDRRNNGRTVA